MAKFKFHGSAGLKLSGEASAKAQSAMEYLMTYGWAILIISIALSALYMMGLFSPSSYISSTCIFPADFSCLQDFMASNGTLSINVEQATESPIEITAIGCNSNVTDANMQLYTGSNAIYIPIGGNYTFNVPCYSGSALFSGSPGSLFKGYVIINYTDLETGFPHMTTGTLVQKIT
ncbi:MAG: hypothetical protein QXW10_00080 [Candidatus Micrarchaeaceae archaeon]